MSASEMKTFVLNAGLIFGDLILDKNNKHWELFKLLRQILSISLQTYISKGTPQLLETLIQEHHALFLQLYGDSLKPKHHNILHYPRVMRQIGPLRHIWAMRFEAKHRPSKQNAAVTCNRINLCRTLAIKHQLSFSHVLSQTKLFPDIIYKKYRNECPLPCIDKPCLPNDFANSQIIKYVIVTGIKYKIGATLLARVDEFPVFGKIENVYLKNNCLKFPEKCDFLFLIKVFKCLQYDSHYQAYMVEDTKVLEFVTLNSIIHNEKLNMVMMSDGHMYVAYL